MMNYNPQALGKEFWLTPYYACILHLANIQQSLGKKKKGAKVEQIPCVSYSSAACWEIEHGSFKLSFNKAASVFCLVQFPGDFCKLSINSASLRVPVYHWRILLLAFGFHMAPMSSF